MESWIAEAVGTMHVNKITQNDVAQHMNVTPDYISMILRGVKTPKNAEERIMTAINDIINERLKVSNNEQN